MTEGNGHGVSNVSPAQDLMVRRVIWFSMFVFPLVAYFAMPRVGDGFGFPFILVPLLPFFASLAVRLFVLPLSTQPERRLSIFIVGLALGEATALKGIFLAPDQALAYVVLALVAIASYVPVGLKESRSPR